MKSKILTILLIFFSFTVLAQSESTTDGNFFNNSAVLGGVIGAVVGVIIGIQVGKKRKNK